MVVSKYITGVLCHLVKSCKAVTSGGDVLRKKIYILIFLYIYYYVDIVCMLGAAQMIQGEAGCMKQLKLWMFLICFALGFDSSEGKKCCVSKAYAVCWVTPNFWENALTAEKNKTLPQLAYTV